MALGFGFNKTKVLAAAEKYVQQGKLQNAITEYEKVTKEDPKDLTVLNTIGDLYSRVGNNDHAAIYFRKVGDAYANEGFTVKAIAMYKKLTKMSPGVMETMQRLAELYTVQGLYNDARSQYVMVADSQLKSGNNDDAAKTFQKILELDPDNTAMQTKLADLYIKLGKKTEARNIYYTAAQSLYAKQAMDAADEALARVLSIDPKNVDALLLRGTIAAESGDGTSAINYLNDIPDIDSRPDALRSMLRAQLQLKKFDEATPLANKLINVHNDMTGITWLAESFLNEGRYADGIQLYEQHADKLLAANGPALVKSLTSAISKVKESSAALESLRNLFHKAGETTHDYELMELLAHVFVQEGQLEKAKELYKELATSEPENPLHQQNYKQVIALLGEDATTLPLTEEQAQQPFLADDAPVTSQLIVHEYDAETAHEIQVAITDAELFDSYNLPQKAIPPLEAGLKHAPRDSQLHLRLSQLYVKVGRYVDAARSYNILKELYEENGKADESAKYGDLAGKYLRQVGATLEEATAAVTMDDLPAEAPAMGDFDFATGPPPSIDEVPAEPSVNIINLQQAQVEPPPPVVEPPRESGVDDWESMLSVEEPAPPPISMEVSAPSVEPPPAQEISIPQEPVPSFEMEVQPEAAGESVSEFSFESMTSEEAIEIPVEEPAPEPEPAPPPPPVVVAPPPVVAPPSPPPPKVAAPPPKVVVPLPPPPAPAPVAKASEDFDLLGDLVSDLEESLAGVDFGGSPAPPPVISEPEPLPLPAPIAPESVPVGFSSMGHEMPTLAPEIAHHEAADELSDMFSEFKEDAEASAGEAEDPDTHYNLGIAFKEMGLLDEAIGELQKVCHAVERGHPFDQPVQAFTWLAQCLVDKGVPQAAIRWYEKALKVPGMNEDSRLAVYYDMASAYEMAGEQKKAYITFMEVYSSNIDYRDVAERIKSLKP